MNGSNWTSGAIYGPEDRRREYRRQKVGVALITGVMLVSIAFSWHQEPATVLYLLALIAVMLVFLWTRRHAKKADEAGTEQRKP